MTSFSRAITRLALTGALFIGATVSVQASVITKAPDLGPYWFPLSSDGSYVYADSFVAPDSGFVSSLGLWLMGGPNDLVLNVFGSIGGNPASGPDSTNVIALTAVIPGQTFGSLTFISAPTVSSLALIAGDVYWFAASTVGLAGTVEYQVGGHSQNSVYADNGTFWYSNDPTGIAFDGQGVTPEMAFQVSTVPEPGTLLLLGAGLAGLVALRRRAA